VVELGVYGHCFPESIVSLLMLNIYENVQGDANLTKILEEQEKALKTTLTR
jgi:hypothetical protein